MSTGEQVMSERALRLTMVTEMTGLSRSTLWRLERDGDFPARRQLGPNRVAWLASEVEAWLRRRPTTGPSQPGNG